MIKRILFILCLICLLVIPVSGYTLLNEWTQNSQTAYTEIKAFYIANNGITHIEQEPALCKYISGPNGAEATQTGTITNQSGTYGDYSITYDFPTADYGASTIVIDIYNFTGTLSNSYVFAVSGCANAWGWQLGACQNKVYCKYSTGGDQSGGTNQGGAYGNPNSGWDYQISFGGHTEVYGGTATPPTTNKTITVTVKNLANEVVTNQFVDIFGNENIEQSYQSGYTNSSGMITFSDVMIQDDNTSTHLSSVATYIYAQYDEDFDFDSSPMSKTIYLTSQTPSGDYADVTYHISDSVTSLPVSNALVVHTVNPDYDTFAYTNISGYAFLNDVPIVDNVFYYEISAANYHTKSGALMWAGTYPANISIETSLVPSSIPITPTPIPTVTSIIPTDSFTMIATPNAIPLGGSSTLTVSCSNSSKWNDAHLIIYSVKLPNQQLYPYGTFRKNATSGYYDYSPFGGTYTPTSTNGRSLTVNPTLNGNHEYNVAVINTTPVTHIQTTLGTAKANLMVGESGYYGTLTMRLSAHEGTTFNQILNVAMNLTNVDTGTIEDLGIVGYDIEKTLPRGSAFILQGSKSGYQDGSITFTVPTDETIEYGDPGAMKSVPMWKIGDISAGNTTISVHVTDIETYFPLGNVKISLNSEVPKYTGNSGEPVTFQLSQNTDYIISAEKSGYCSVQTAGNTETEEFIYEPLYMKYGSCAITGTPTPTPTPSATVTPYGNWSPTDEASVCGDLPTNATFVDVLKNSLACNGFETSESQNMGMAMIIILFAGIILGRIAGGIGVLAGVIAGAVVAMAMGFLPFWIIIVVIIIAGLVFAARMFWSGGGSG